MIVFIDYYYSYEILIIYCVSTPFWTLFFLHNLKLTNTIVKPSLSSEVGTWSLCSPSVFVTVTPSVFVTVISSVFVTVTPSVCVTVKLVEEDRGVVISSIILELFFIEWFSVCVVLFEVVVDLLVVCAFVVSEVVPNGSVVVITGNIVVVDVVDVDTTLAGHIVSLLVSVKYHCTPLSNNIQTKSN